MAEEKKEAKIIFVKLVNSEKAEKEFRFDHAANILKTEESYLKERKIKIASWTLPEDSKYIFENGNLIERGSNPANKGTKVSEGNSEGKAKTAAP